MDDNFTPNKHRRNPHEQQGTTFSSLDVRTGTSKPKHVTTIEDDVEIQPSEQRQRRKNGTEPGRQERGGVRDSGKVSKSEQAGGAARASDARQPEVCTTGNEGLGDGRRGYRHGGGGPHRVPAARTPPGATDGGPTDMEMA